MIGTSLIAIVVAMVLVRRGWGGPASAAAAGWTIAAAAAIALAHAAGAWGLTLGCVAAILVALAILAREGWRSPRKPRRAPRDAPSVAPVRSGADIARRAAVFTLVVPVAFAAAQALAFGAQAWERRMGADEADATATMLFLQPLLWGMLMTWQVTRAGPARMVVPPALAAALGVLLWGIA